MGTLKDRYLLFFTIYKQLEGKKNQNNCLVSYFYMVFNFPGFFTLVSPGEKRGKFQIFHVQNLFFFYFMYRVWTYLNKSLICHLRISFLVAFRVVEGLEANVVRREKVSWEKNASGITSVISPYVAQWKITLIFFLFVQ